MMFHCDGARGKLRTFRLFVTGVLALLVGTAAAGAQTAAPAASAADAKARVESYETIRLVNLTQKTEAIDLVTDLRNLLPRARVYYVTVENAVSVWGTADEIKLAEKIAAEMDKPRKVYRLAFTLAEVENGKRTAVHSYTLSVVNGERASMKLGGRVPIVTGMQKDKEAAAGAQVQYVDTGLKIEAGVEGTHLWARVEESGIAEEKSSIGLQDPIIRQTSLEGMATIVPGKTVSLGSFEIPGGARRMEVEVTAELVP
jgi:type II secretory pathway component GspD/PulD (secretin)